MPLIIKMAGQTGLEPEVERPTRAPHLNSPEGRKNPLLTVPLVRVGKTP